MDGDIIGRVRELWCYPVKSMMGLAVEETHLYWNGLDGDRRYAFVQSGHTGGFPWLTGRQLPGLVRYRPYFVEPGRPYESAVRVVTPAGKDLAVTDEALAAGLMAAWRQQQIHLMQLGRGASDSGAVSLMSLATARRLDDIAGERVDRRRFRQNIILETTQERPYIEDDWLGATLFVGERPDPAALLAVRPIERCQMINIDPETGQRSPGTLQTINRSRDNRVGIYLWPQNVGKIRVGDPVRLIKSK